MARWLHRLLLVNLTVVLALGLFATQPQKPAAPKTPASTRAALWKSAKSALDQNHVKLGDTTYLSAGRHQFRSLWTRDFAWASRGLIAEGQHQIVRDQIDTLLANTGSDNLVPRVLDTISVPRRVIVGTIQGRLGLPAGKKDHQGPLKAQVYDEHGSPSMDSNLLVIKAALDYTQATGDTKWLDGHREQLTKLYRFYDAWKTKDGLLHQPKWSDWQDSVKREGQSFYLNLLYADITQRLGDHSGMNATEREALTSKVKSTFYDPKTGLYKSLVGKNLVSLDGNLLALDLGFVKPDSDEGKALYASLKKSALWTRGGVPGSTTVGDYPKSWLHLPVRITGLSHYHDEMHWSWLIALSAKVAHTMGDKAESERIFDTLGTMVARDGSVDEIYKSSKSGPPKAFGSLLYKSEAPFSWGAGFVLDALAATEKQ